MTMPTRSRARALLRSCAPTRRVSISARISRSSGGSGVSASSGRARIALDGLVERAPRRRPSSPSRRAAAAELARSAPARSSRLRAERPRERGHLPAGAREQRLDRARQHRRVGLRVRDPQHAHERLADARGGGRRAPSRARRRRGSSRARAARGRAPRGRCRAPGRSARRRAAPPSRRPGWRAACRASRRRARARSSRSRAARCSGSVAISGGSASTSSGRTSPSGASWPAGSRWMRVISAPESVVGSAATRPPRTAAIAFATSITRPPPSATRSRCRRPRRSPARRPRRPARAGRGGRPGASSARATGAAPIARSVVSSS